MSTENSEIQKALPRLRKYLVFKLNESQYCVPLSEVKEVIGLPQCVGVPTAPAYFLGLINLRGKVISAIDLKRKLGSSGTHGTVKRPAVIVTECNSVTLGCVVDSILEVLAIDETAIERSLEIRVHEQGGFVQGIARFQDRAMILLLDLKKAADISDLVRLNSAA